MHKTLCVNYTTYNVQRAQDSLNPCTHADLIVLSQEDEDNSDNHPYWYARLLSIFHIDMRHMGPLSTDPSIKCIEFAWVQ